MARAQLIPLGNRRSNRNRTGGTWCHLEASKRLAHLTRVVFGNPAGLLTGGFGYINTGSTFSSQRNGMLEARFQF
jgi:hypothetical protein